MVDYNDLSVQEDSSESARRTFKFFNKNIEGRLRIVEMRLLEQVDSEGWEQRGFEDAESYEKAFIEGQFEIKL